MIPAFIKTGPCNMNLELSWQSRGKPERFSGNFAMPEALFHPGAWLEIARPGRFKDSCGVWHEFSADRLKNMAKAYDPGQREAPLVLGHPLTDSPAHGWVKGLQFNGEKLLAYVAFVSAEVRRAVSEGKYKYVSMSLYENGELRHVGLLGGTPPAIDGLAPVRFSAPIIKEECMTTFAGPGGEDKSLLLAAERYFAAPCVLSALDTAPPIYTPIISTIFPNQIKHPSAAIGVSDIISLIAPVPVVQRNQAPAHLPDEYSDTSLFAPRPIKLSLPIPAAVLNDLRVQGASPQFYTEKKIHRFKRVIQTTLDAMASVVATTGRLTWPSKLEGGGFDIYDLDLGGIRQADPGPDLAWDSFPVVPSFTQVYKFLRELERRILEDGGGGNVKFLAGDDAFCALLTMAEHWNSSGGIGVAIQCNAEGVLNLAGYEVRGVKDRYQYPVDGSWRDKIPADSLIGYSCDQPGTIFYCKTDRIAHMDDPDFEFFDVFVEPTELYGDSSLNVIANCKPFPVRNPKSLIRSKVIGLA